MMDLAKCVIKDLSIKVLEYPEITNPEQGLKNWLKKQLCYTYKQQYNLIHEVEFEGMMVLLHSISFSVMHKATLRFMLF